MVIQYLAFYVSVGMLIAVLLNLVNIFTFRAKGKVIGYQFKIGSAEYNKYSGHAGPKALSFTLLGILVLGILIALQALAVERKHVSESAATLAFGSALAVGFVLWVFYSVASMSEKSGKKLGRSNSKQKDDSWLV